MAEAAWLAEPEQVAFFCGPTSFVEAVADGLAGFGYPLG